MLIKIFNRLTGKINRLFNRFYADMNGYFWMPCPICGENFGGHESGYHSLITSYKVSATKAIAVSRGKLVCKKYTCQEIARISDKEFYDEFWK